MKIKLFFALVMGVSSLGAMDGAPGAKRMLEGRQDPPPARRMRVGSQVDKGLDLESLQLDVVRQLVIGNNTAETIHFGGTPIEAGDVKLASVVGDGFLDLQARAGEYLIGSDCNLVEVTGISLTVGEHRVPFACVTSGVLSKLVNRSGRVLLNDLGEPLEIDAIEMQVHKPNMITLFPDAQHVAEVESRASHCSIVSVDGHGLGIQEEEPEPFEVMVEQYMQVREHRIEIIRNSLSAAMVRVLSGSSTATTIVEKFFEDQIKILLMDRCE